MKKRENSNYLQKGKAVTPGSVIGVVACGSPVEPETLTRGLNELRVRGYQVCMPLDAAAGYGETAHGFSLTAATARSKALMQLIEDADVKAIIAARGGYGSMDLLPLLDFGRWQAVPKPLVGYSDVTVLLLSGFLRSQVVTIHGPVIGEEFAAALSDNVAKANVDRLFEMLSRPNFTLTNPCEIVRAGEAVGWILPANLTMLLTLLGTPWDLSYDGAILVLEDVNEPPYRIHRGLKQLNLAGKLDRLAGLVFGRLSMPGADKGGERQLLRYSLGDVFSDMHFPILCGLEFGHHGKNISLPVGVRGAIKDGVFTVLESAVC